MSDDEEYEYEYDDDEMEEGNFEYTDEEEEQDNSAIALENAYYNAKGLRETDTKQAAAAFEQVIQQEEPKGSWSYKALKQLVKLHLRAADYNLMIQSYGRLLDCVANGVVSPNAIEKGINGMLERVASLYQGRQQDHEIHNVASAVYDETLMVFHPITGSCKNERLWFKANLKYGQLLYEMHKTDRLQQVLKDLQSVPGALDDDSQRGSSTQSMEIYALQIQLFSRQKDNKRLRDTFHKAMAVRGGIPHPRTLALIQEFGGRMYMQVRDYEAAGKTFFSAFKSYDEAGDPNRLRCLKYLVLASMLHASTINPFDSQEARPYRDDPEIVAMTNLVQAFHANDIQTFERILRQNQSRIMGDEFVREYIEDLLRTIRTQVLRRVIRPYKRISLQAIADELNGIAVTEVESLLVSLILEKSLDGKIDQVAGVLHKEPERGSENKNESSHLLASKSKRPLVVQCDAVDDAIRILQEFSTQVASLGMREGTAMRGMIH